MAHQMNDTLLRFSSSPLLPFPFPASSLHRFPGSVPSPFPRFSPSPSVISRLDAVICRLPSGYCVAMLDFSIILDISGVEKIT